MTNKRFLLLVLTSVSFCLIGWLGFCLVQEKSKTYFDEEATKFKSIQVFGDDKFVLVSVEEGDERAPIYYGQNYVSTLSIHSLETKDMKKSPPIGETEYYHIISYDLNSPEITKTETDLYKMADFRSTAGYRVNSVLTGYYGDGRDYLARNMYAYDDGRVLKERFLFEIGNRKILTQDVHEKTIEIATNDPYRNIISLSPGGVGESISNNLLQYHLSKFEGTLSPAHDGDSTYKHRINIMDTNFAQLYPEVAKNMKDMTQLYFRPAQYNQKEWFDNLLHWFAPKGQDVMEVYATDETTGEKTQIKSFDEYLSWCKAHPEEVKKYDKKN